MRTSDPERLRARRRLPRLSRVAVALPLLFASLPALAGGPLRRAGAAGTPSTADLAAAAAVQAAAAAQQSQDPLRLAFDALKKAQMAQAAAAAAAQAATQSVPNGNQPGGLILSSDPTLAPVNASWPTYATQGGRTEVTVTQNASRAILNWTSFNIGKNTDLYFDQTAGGSDASGWVALNRIIGGSPSQILGSIKAEGQVYLINQNGILFGGTSQVNVGSLVLSGLDLSALTKSSGQVVPESSYSAWSQAFVDPSTKLYTLTFVSAPQSDGSVTIEEGAQLSAASGGRVMLLGRKVGNKGSISVPSGQAFLAAGPKVTLTADASATGSRGVALDYANSDLRGGVVTNGPIGLVSAPLGTVTMVSEETNQDGTILAHHRRASERSPLPGRPVGVRERSLRCGHHVRERKRDPDPARQRRAEGPRLGIELHPLADQRFRRCDQRSRRRHHLCAFRHRRAQRADVDDAGHHRSHRRGLRPRPGGRHPDLPRPRGPAGRLGALRRAGGHGAERHPGRAARQRASRQPRAPEQPAAGKDRVLRRARGGRARQRERGRRFSAATWASSSGTSRS